MANYEVDKERRKFVSLIAKGIGLSFLTGSVWSVLLPKSSNATLLLRPPGALNETHFLQNCIKCGQCVQACPYDTLKLGNGIADQVPVGTPYYKPREIPCYMCPDVPCVPVCPTDALQEDRLYDDSDSLKMNINNARMGVAIIDEKSCIAFWGIQCDACYRACPLLGDAIKLDYKRIERTGKHAYLTPFVDSDHCTGCGLCERACVTKKAAIYILPRQIAMGEIGTHYIKGWDKEDERRLEFLPSDKGEVLPKDSEDVTDYLNKGLDYE